ncbi:unnamed protein product [Protopolystoma xenopodis]|uniref:Uncharacterized protein n=1 Tax=Protopolystoma xenopodis TaxID=117903 RepID=A0A448XBN4_9PLAT|nr:unnamed protein product [Protopolystoma xenopodis]
MMDESAHIQASVCQRKWTATCASAIPSGRDETEHNVSATSTSALKLYMSCQLWLLDEPLATVLLPSQNADLLKNNNKKSKRAPLWCLLASLTVLETEADDLGSSRFSRA